MHFIALSVCFSVAVSALLKLARRFDVDVRPAIALNYVVAAVGTWYVLHPAPRLLLRPLRLGTAWLLVTLALALILPLMFQVLAVTVRRAGVARTEAAQRLSLLLPLIASFTLFGQALTPWLGGGLMLGLLAMAALLGRHGRDALRGEQSGGADRPWLLVTFVGMGCIDVLFKRQALLGRTFYAESLLAVFIGAALVSAVIVLATLVRGRLRMPLRTWVFGLVLGACNFGNILFYLWAHRALPHDPVLVFSAMNLGVLALASLVGTALFRERLTRLHAAGLGLAAVAVLAIAAGS